MAGNGFDTKLLDNLMSFYKNFFINQFSKDLSQEEIWTFILRQQGKNFTRFTRKKARGDIMMQCSPRKFDFLCFCNEFRDFMRNSG